MDKCGKREDKERRRKKRKVIRWLELISKQMLMDN